MTVSLIIDADFLSAFLKIERLALVFQFYGVERLQVTPAVYRELAQTSLLAPLTNQSGLTLTIPAADQLETLRQDEAFHRLGVGEQESIALALTTEDALLLSNDNQARQLATALGVTVINIPAFLLACKLAGELTRHNIQQIIDDLWQKDYYKFRADVQAQLLA